MRAAVCCLLVIAVMWPAVASCMQPAPVQVTVKGPDSTKAVQMEGDHFWTWALRKVVVYVGGKLVDLWLKGLWEWRGGDPRPVIYCDLPHTMDA